MRILLLGDTHANENFVVKAIALAEELQCERVVQVGDFGYWPGRHDGFLVGIRKHLKRSGITLDFLRGNHENHDALDELDKSTNRTPEGFVRVRAPKGGAINLLPRAGTWEWDGVRFGCLGGAYSIDRGRRTKYVSWFPQEMPTLGDVERLLKCDVLLTHDAPQLLLPPLGDRRDDEGRPSQEAVRKAIEYTRPSLLVHGHWHLRTVYTHERTVCIGLDADVNGNLHAATIVLDTGALAWYTINQAIYNQEGTPL